MSGSFMKFLSLTTLSDVVLVILLIWLLIMSYKTYRFLVGVPYVDDGWQGPGCGCQPTHPRPSIGNSQPPKNP